MAPIQEKKSKFERRRQMPFDILHADSHFFIFCLLSPKAFPET
jgi:hypothetical protein